MGLDTSHGCWHGAYSAFYRWRQKLAEVAGYEIGRESDRDIPMVMLDWGHLPDGWPEGKWDKTPEDPLVVLIAHSDCYGAIYPEQAGPLADRLEQLLPLLPEEPDTGHIGDWREKTQAFIDGLRSACAANEPVDFH